MSKKPIFIRDPSLHELKPNSKYSYSSKNQRVSLTLEDMIRRATEGVNVVPPTTSSQASQHQIHGNGYSTVITTAIMLFFVVLLTVLAINNTRSHPYSNNNPAPDYLTTATAKAIYIPPHPNVATGEHMAMIADDFKDISNVHIVLWQWGGQSDIDPMNVDACMQYTYQPDGIVNPPIFRSAHLYKFHFDNGSWSIINIETYSNGTCPS